MSGLKLFVWEDVIIEGNAGVMFALAHDVEEAHRLIMEKVKWPYSVPFDLVLNPKEVVEPEGFVLMVLP